MQIENINGEWKISLVSLPYNINALLHDFEESGIYDKYHWWALLISKCIQTGINYSLLALTRAKQLADNQYDLIDEIHWEQAVSELGIG